jgi:hypothetical protein
LFFVKCIENEEEKLLGSKPIFGLICKLSCKKLLVLPCLPVCLSTCKNVKSEDYGMDVHKKIWVGGIQFVEALQSGIKNWRFA